MASAWRKSGSASAYRFCRWYEVASRSSASAVASLCSPSRLRRCLERGTEVRLRLLVAVQVHQRLAQPLAVVGHLEAVRAIERRVLLQRLPEQRDRLVVEPEARVRAAEDAAELRLDLGLTGEARVHPPRALREQRARGDVPAVPPRRAHRVGHVEDAHHPVAHLLGLLRLELRALPEPALAREPAGEQGQDRRRRRHARRGSARRTSRAGSPASPARAWIGRPSR